MQSKILENLYFAGEIINLDANTGGYNMQIAFSTARLAAQNIVKQLEMDAIY
jgi:predicted flavoprotein YhiN